MLKKKFLRTLKEQDLVRENMHLVIGFSGGPDSLCLFHLLDSVSQELKLKLYPVHINHKFRPGAAEEDQAFAEAFSRSMGWECRTFVRDCLKLAETEKLSSEEAGRKVRYDAFGQVASEIEATGVKKKDIAIVVAQNADDQAETILFRILRGSGIDGIAGIAPKRYDGAGFAVIRPLLEVSRREIEEYCEEKGLEPRIDKTNAEPIYTRNKIRLELIPLLESLNPNIKETVNRLGKAAASDKDYINGEACALYESIKTERVLGDKKEVSILISPLDKVHNSLIMRIYNMALREVGMWENVTNAHLTEIDKVRLSENPSALTDLGGYVVSKAYDKLVFLKGRVEPFSTEGAGNLFSEEAGWKLTELDREAFKAYEKEACSKGLTYGAFSAGKIGNPEKLEIRKRQKGDKIAIKGGSKKLQDLLVDWKVPKLYRDDIFLLALGNEILWVLPSEIFTNSTLREKGRFSADFKVDFRQDDRIIVLERPEKL